MDVSMYRPRTKDFLDNYFKRRDVDWLIISAVEERHMYRAKFELDVLYRWSKMVGAGAMDDIYLVGSQVKKIVVKVLNSKIDEFKKASKQIYENRLNRYKKDILKADSMWSIERTKEHIDELKNGYKLVENMYTSIDAGVEMFIPIEDKYSTDNYFLISKGLLTSDDTVDYTNYTIGRHLSIRDEIILSSINIVLKDNFNEICKEVSKDYNDLLQAFEEEKLKILRDI